MVLGAPTRIAGLVVGKAEDLEGGFDPAQAAAPKDQRKMDRFILFALLAAAEAVAQAKWAPKIRRAGAHRDNHCLRHRWLPAIVEAVRTTDQRGVRRLSPFTFLRSG